MSTTGGCRGGQPHLVWKGKTFAPEKPTPPPKINVNVTMMHAANEKFGRKWRGSRKGISDSKVMEAVADTGCQTCTAGIDVIQQLRCSISHLVPTRRRIVGITDSSLAIISVAFLHIGKSGGKETRQHGLRI